MIHRAANDRALREGITLGEGRAKNRQGKVPHDLKHVPGEIGSQHTVWYQRRLEPLAARLNLQDQGIFQLGYYHQKQKFFTKKEENSNV